MNRLRKKNIVAACGKKKEIFLLFFVQMTRIPDVYSLKITLPPQKIQIIYQNINETSKHQPGIKVSQVLSLEKTLLKD
jgi:hypothetical protein